MKTLKNGQKQAIKFDRWCKNAKHSFINKHFINVGIVVLFSIIQLLIFCLYKFFH